VPPGGGVGVLSRGVGPALSVTPPLLQAVRRASPRQTNVRSIDLTDLVG
jgi:hypothetical protein